MTSKVTSAIYEPPCKRLISFKDVTPEITVFRFSQDKYTSYLVKKAQRLGESEVLLKCETLVRGLARNGLMDDNNEELLKGMHLEDSNLGC